MPEPDEAIRFESVSKCFLAPVRGEVWALRDIDLACEAGKLTCVLGPSGCGKTTLLRIAAGLDQPTSGQVLVNCRCRAGRPGLVSQEGDLLPWRRALANVLLGLEVQSVPRAQRKARARAALRRVGLGEELEECFPHELSGGMRQRVAIARALCPNPRIILMDEPFASLDEPMRYRLQEELLALWAQDPRTIVFVTHSIEEAVFLADRIVILAEGRKVREFAIELPRPRDRLAAEFARLLLDVRRSVAIRAFHA